MGRKISKAIATLATAGAVAMLGSGMAMADTSTTQVETQAQSDEIYFQFHTFEECRDHANFLTTHQGAKQAGCERVDNLWILSVIF